jgi:sortase A
VAWSLVTWRWQDPITALYGRYEQHRLAGSYAARLNSYGPTVPVEPGRSPVSIAWERRRVALEARDYRASLKPGDPVGRLRIPRLGLDAIVVQGTGQAQLDEGPGHYPRSFLPGQGNLVYIAGHRTTFSAPFAHIERLRRGDPIVLSLPYGTFVYRVRRHVIVPANDVGRLRTHGREILALQSCHPRFSASHRYIVYALPVEVIPRGLRRYAVSARAGRLRGSQKRRAQRAT